MKKVGMIVAVAAVLFGSSPAVAEITTCPTFTTNITNVLCINKSPKFDKRVDLTGQIYCSTSDDGAPEGYIQVDNYKKQTGSSIWKGSCRASCSNLNQWPILNTLPDVTSALCP